MGMIFSSPVPQKACTSSPSGSRCMLFAGQVMKIPYPPVVQRIITTYYSAKCLIKFTALYNALMRTDTSFFKFAFCKICVAIFWSQSFQHTPLKILVNFESGVHVFSRVTTYSVLLRYLALSVGVIVYCRSTMNCYLDETESRQLKH